MPTAAVLVANALIAVILIGLAATERPMRALGRRSAAVAVLPLASAGLLIAYVFGEDTYRGNGISRWDAYRTPGGALGPMFVLSVVLMVGAAVMIALAAARGRVGLARFGACAAGVVAFFLLGATILGFSLN